MKVDTADPFTAVKTPQGRNYALSPSDRWPKNQFSHGLILAGVLLLSGTIFLGFITIADVPRLGWPSASSFVLPLVFLILGVVMGIILFQPHLGRDELQLDAATIRVIRRIGPFCWWKTVRRSKVSQLTVVEHSWFEDKFLKPPERHERHELVAEDEQGRRRKLVSNYPREVLLALAAELSVQWKLLSMDSELFGIGRGKLAVGEDLDDPTEVRERFDRPERSRLQFQDLGQHGVRISRPAEGFDNAWFIIGAIVGGVLLRWAIELAIPLILGLPGNVKWFWLIFTALFGLFLSCAAVCSVFCRFALIATPESLTLDVSGLLQGPRKVWKKHEIAAIFVWTEVTSNSKYITQLWIQSTSSTKPKPLQTWPRLTKPEMEWIATTLRSVLNVPA